MRGDYILIPPPELSIFVGFWDLTHWPRWHKSSLELWCIVKETFQKLLRPSGNNCISSNLVWSKPGNRESEASQCRWGRYTCSSWVDPFMEIKCRVWVSHSWLLWPETTQNIHPHGCIQLFTSHRLATQQKGFCFGEKKDGHLATTDKSFWSWPLFLRQIFFLLVSLFSFWFFGI